MRDGLCRRSKSMPGVLVVEIALLLPGQERWKTVVGGVQYALAVVQQPHLVRGHKVAPGLLAVDAVIAAAPLALVVTGGGDGFFSQQFRNILVGFFLGAAEVEKLVAQTDQ